MVHVLLVTSAADLAGAMARRSWSSSAGAAFTPQPSVADVPRFVGLSRRLVYSELRSDDAFEVMVLYWTDDSLSLPIFFRFFILLLRNLLEMTFAPHYGHESTGFIFYLPTLFEHV